MNSCRYNSYETIPAVVFFKIRETRDFQLLKPKPSTSVEWLSQMFAQIYDDYFRKVDNKDADRYLELLENEKELEVRINGFKAVLKLHWETPKEIWDNPTIIQARMESISKLNQFLDVPIDLDADFDAEIQNALTISIGIIQNDLSEVKMELEQLRKYADKTVFDFYESLQAINETNQLAVRSNLLLAEYVAAEKSAIKKAERAKLKQTANG